MLNNEFYPAVFKRKSFHLFRNAGKETLSPEELGQIETAFAGFERLYPEIRTAVRIVPASKVNFKRDAEYCVLLYSEKKDNYLTNAGYLGEQLDLYLVSRNIGTLWYGFGKPDMPVYDGLDYVIMIAVRKISDESLFRKDMFKAKRKPLEKIWSGETLGAAEIARFAPSAVNSQPWFAENDGKTIRVSRVRTVSAIMTAAAAYRYNRIDTGIFLCILEICLAEKGVSAERTLLPDGTEAAVAPVADYVLRK